jgi:Cu(I)/Ag(I) efflux system membrane protein CusA/SilA
MRRIAVPMIGGMLSSMVLTLVVISAVFALVTTLGLKRASAVPEDGNPRRTAG